MFRPVPLGCIRELFIGGPQVACGYPGGPEQTKKVFINEPFQPGSTMNAFTDLVCMNPVDLSITYLGRRDMMVLFAPYLLSFIFSSLRMCTNSVRVQLSLAWTCPLFDDDFFLPCCICAKLHRFIIRADYHFAFSVMSCRPTGKNVDSVFNISFPELVWISVLS